MGKLILITFALSAYAFAQAQAQGAADAWGTQHGGPESLFDNTGVTAIDNINNAYSTGSRSLAGNP